MTIQDILAEICLTVADPADVNIAIKYGHGRKQEANLYQDVDKSRVWLHEVIYGEDVTDAGVIYDVVTIGLDVVTKTNLYDLQQDTDQSTETLGALQTALNVTLLKTKEIENKLRNHPQVVNKDGIKRLVRRPLYNAYDANLTGWVMALEVKLMPQPFDYCVPSFGNFEDDPYTGTSIHGREVVLRFNEGWVQWQYEGEDEWTNLYEVGEGGGEQGPPGEDGLSAYEIAVNNGFVGNEAAWLASLVGPQGEPGTNGTDGNDGADGEDGINGENGLSAYEIAVANGFLGTEVEWLESLQGEQGPQGIPGNDGDDGLNGNDGAPGNDGLSAYEVAVDNGFVGTEAEWLLSLVGPQGEQGDPGTNGTNASTVLQTTSAAGQSSILFDFNSYPGYTHFEVEYYGVYTNNNNSPLWIRACTGNPATAHSGASDYRHTRHAVSTTGTGTTSADSAGGDGDDAQIVLNTLGLSNVSTNTVDGSTRIVNPSQTTSHHCFQSRYSLIDSAATPNTADVTVTGYYKSTTAVTGIEFKPGGSNQFAGGTFRLIGKT